MDEVTEVLVPEFPEQDETCTNCGACCASWSGLTGHMRYCPECGYSELV